MNPMKRVRTFLLFLLLSPLVGWAQVPGAPSVFLDTDPMGSRIFLDGKLLPDRTPALLRGLSAGPHELVIWHEGFLRSNQKFVVAADAVPTVQVSLSPDSAVLAFPADGQIVDPQGNHVTDGKQFRYPAGTYQFTTGDSLHLTPVFPDEGLLTAAGWGLLALFGAAVVSTGSDVYHISTGWQDHPSEITAALWLSTLFELPWYGSLLGRKAKFQRDTAPSVTALPQPLDRAQALFDRGEAALQAGQLDQAEPLLARLVKEFPDSRLTPGAWFRLARIHLIAGRRDLALGEYRLVAETYPQAATYDRARKALADLYEAAGEPGKALENLDLMVLRDGFFDKADITAQKVRLSAAQGVPHAP
jgi:outer membrane protein assembly factor BamD (BamD/ComL family)